MCPAVSQRQRHAAHTFWFSQGIVAGVTIDLQDVYRMAAMAPRGMNRRPDRLRWTSIRSTTRARWQADSLPQTQLQNGMPELTSNRNHGAGTPLRVL